MKKYKKDQDNYNNLFFNIENNLRELGFGDVSVNKKMKDLNKVFYDILLKINKEKTNFKINIKLVAQYFEILRQNDANMEKFQLYFEKFYKFCFDLPYENMIKDIKNYKL